MTEDPYIPLVTVVIPTYNRMPYIIEAIDSVIAQTYSNWELIVVDDGSTDGTVTAVKAMADERIHIIELYHEGMVGSLRNTGALVGDGEWISFLDSDDAWMPNKLELQVKTLKQTGFECCYGNFELMNESGQIVPVKAGKFKPLSGNITRELLTTEAAMTMDSVMLSRKLFTKVGGFSTDPRLKYRDDYELALRLALNAGIVALPDVLVRVREHSGRRTNLLSLAEAHGRSALPYEMFIMNNPEITLKKLAREQYSHHMRTAVKINFRMGNYRLAFKQLKKLISITGIFKKK